MTIFLKVLTELIIGQLHSLIVNLNRKVNSSYYNKNLSIDQKNLVDKLNKAIMIFVPNFGYEEEDFKKIKDSIEQVYKAVQEVRKKYKASIDEGNTITCLRNLLTCADSFHNILERFEFKLLNRPYSETPENIIYYLAAYFLGEELFNPKLGIDVQLRAEKEKMLAKRLQTLNELIKPTYTLEERKERCYQVLTDIESDNRNIIASDRYTNISLPKISLYGPVQIIPRVEWFTPSEGRMKTQFIDHARRQIDNMTIQTFAPFLKDEQAEEVEQNPLSCSM